MPGVVSRYSAKTPCEGLCFGQDGLERGHSFNANEDDADAKTSTINNTATFLPTICR